MVALINGAGIVALSLSVKSEKFVTNLILIGDFGCSGL